jgi:hypothetical protein
MKKREQVLIMDVSVASKVSLVLSKLTASIGNKSGESLRCSGTPVMILPDRKLLDFLQIFT